jgi:hypothetical protein
VDLKLDGALRSSQLELEMTTKRREWLGLHGCSDQLLVCWPGRSNIHGISFQDSGARIPDSTNICLVHSNSALRCCLNARPIRARRLTPVFRESPYILQTACLVSSFRYQVRNLESRASLGLQNNVSSLRRECLILHDSESR